MTPATSDPTTSQPASIATRIRLLVRVWVTAVAVQVALRRHPLPEAARSLGRHGSDGRTPPALLSRAVSRGLRIGPWRPRCLIRSLVLYRLLREQGDPADLVIGLPERADSHEAHAWVELDGRDIGPWPGRGRHQELTRYPRSA
jgi:hypothetical protein